MGLFSDEDRGVEQTRGMIDGDKLSLAFRLGRCQDLLAEVLQFHDGTLPPVLIEQITTTLLAQGRIVPCSD